MKSAWKENNGQYSIRRILATWFALVSTFCFVSLAFIGERPETLKWVAIAGGVCLLASLIAIFFTTWTAIKELVQAVKGDDEGEKPTRPVGFQQTPPRESQQP